MLIIAGVLSFLVAFFHFRLPALFNWKSDSEKIGTAKSRIHHTNNLALALLFAGCGLLTLIFADELAHPSGMAFGMALFLSLFWLWRMLWEIFYFKMPKGPKPKAPVMIHYGLMIVSAVAAAAYASPVVKILSGNY